MRVIHRCGLYTGNYGTHPVITELAFIILDLFGYIVADLFVVPVHIALDWEIRFISYGRVGFALLDEISEGVQDRLPFL